MHGPKPLTVRAERERSDVEVGPEPSGPARRLSFAQEQLWFLDQLSPGSTDYSVLMVWRLHGPLKVDLLQRSLNLVMTRHESLRVTIHEDDGTPYQVVAAPSEVPLPVTDLRALPATERAHRIQAEIEAQRAEPFDLQTGPLCRFQLWQLDSEEYVFGQGFHHIITDGWSTATLNSELSTAYRNLHAGTEPVFDDRELDYTEFAESQRERLQGPLLAEELEFWQQHLAGLPVLELPTDRPRPSGGHHHGETLIKPFPDDLRSVVRQLADDHGASMFMVIAAAYNLVLSRYSGLEDIPTGVPMLGRPEPELEAVVGMFVNMVVLRSDLSGDPTFSDLIDRVADANLELYEHQEVSFNQVVEVVQPIRDPDRNPLFQVSIQLLGGSTSGESLNLPEVVDEFVPLASLNSRFDISVNIVDTGSSLRAAVEYSSDLFDEWRIAAMLTHLETVLRTVSADPGRRLSQIPIVSGAEAEQLRRAGRGADRQIYVVDPTMNLMPRGVVGELLVADPSGTDSSAAGTVLDDPFQPGRPVRRTGELVYWDSDFQIQGRERVGGRASARPEPGGSLRQIDGGPDGELAGEELASATERSVAAIFGEVLSVPRMGADENFFDVGGNSLQAMRAVSRINKGFGIKLSVRTLYGNATVRAVSAAVDEKMGELTRAARPAD